MSGHNIDTQRRPVKRQRQFKTRHAFEDEDDDGDLEAVDLASIVRQRRQKKQPQSELPQALEAVTDKGAGEVSAFDKASQRFAPQTGHNATATLDKHMLSYVERAMNRPSVGCSQSEGADSTGTVAAGTMAEAAEGASQTIDQKQETDKTTTTASYGRLEEINVAPRRRHDRQVPKKRQRDKTSTEQAVEQLLGESTFENIYENPRFLPESREATGTRVDLDDAIAARFRQDYLQSSEAKQAPSRPAAGLPKAVPQKGPRPGGSRNAR